MGLLSQELLCKSEAALSPMSKYQGALTVKKGPVAWTPW